MHRIDENTVEFTTVGELRAKERFEELLEDGQSIALAAGQALEEQISLRWKFSSAFVEYLSDGTLAVTRSGTGIVMLTAFGGQVEGFTQPGRLAVIRMVREGRSFPDAVAHVRGRPAILRTE